MHILKSIQIYGFRNQEAPIELRLSKNANFLIGRNGTGKTTLINLVHAALTVDVEVLREISFDKIEFRFSRKGSRKIPHISVLQRDYDGLERQIDYTIRTFAGDQVRKFNLTSPQRRVVISEHGRRIVTSRPNRTSLKEILRSVFSVTWLSLQRGGDLFSDDEEIQEQDSTDVDRKLEQVTVALSGYLSRLDKEVTAQTQTFQKNWFLSFLISGPRSTHVSMNRINLSAEKETLKEIFEKFDVDSEQYEQKIETHFNIAERIVSTSKPSLTDLFHITDITRLHDLVVQWQDLQKLQKETYKPKLQFTAVASAMLYRKTIVINTSNRLEVMSDSGVSVPPKKLSSGEKQLLIFLSEALLQEGRPYIFLADEPELSLHVEWQEELVPSLLKLNPSAQVLFATHSPDIVSVFQENVFEMEKLS